jgi:alpha-L-fucosidase
MLFLGLGAPASQAVNGNTQGVWYNNSITHTQKEQGAWWQVDLKRVKITLAALF